jgi:2-polyprenyl-3-methyl-5-hydroxy-6-metoxy-1,4-benzoquinol methylase
MRTDAKKLEEGRLSGLTLDNYPILHERHRIFPEVFKNRKHTKVLDISAGIGIVARRILESYPCDMHCNEIDETCLTQLKKLNVTITSHDLDTGAPIPLETAAYDAVICLATIEHLLNIDAFVAEVHRILKEDGRLYLSVPNYAALYWMIPLLRGRTFHDPFGEQSRYEFYAHIRYFTYRTLLDYMRHFGFIADTVYLPVPKGSSHFLRIRNRSKLLAFGVQSAFRLLYKLSPRWHQEPVICFAKETTGGKLKKRVI